MFRSIYKQSTVNIILTGERVTVCSPLRLPEDVHSHHSWSPEHRKRSSRYSGQEKEVRHERQERNYDVIVGAENPNESPNEHILIS